MRDIVAFFKRAWFYLFLAASVGYLIFFVTTQAKQLDQPLSFSPLFAILLIVFQLVFWWIYSRQWSRTIQFLSNVEVSTLEAFRQISIMNLGKYLPGKVWGMLARGSALLTQGVPAGKIFTATLIEQQLVFHTAFVLSACIWAMMRPTSAYICLAAASVITLPLGALVTIRLHGLFARGLRLFGKPVSDNARISINVRQYMGLSGRHVIGWLANGGIFASLYFAFFSIEPTMSIVSLLVLANTLGVTIGFLAVFAPGGIGVREAITASLLTQVMPLQEAVALAIIFRLWLVALDAAIAIYLFIGRQKTQQA